MPDVVSAILEDVLSDHEYPRPRGGAKVHREAVIEVARRVLRILDSTTIETKLPLFVRSRLLLLFPFTGVITLVLFLFGYRIISGTFLRSRASFEAQRDFMRSHFALT